MKKINNKGVAGLELALSVITMLFVMGLLVMVYSLMGSELQGASYTSTTVTFGNTTATPPLNATGFYYPTLATIGADRDCQLTIDYAINTTGATSLINSANWTVSGCFINGSTASALYLNFPINISGSYTYDADNTATLVMNETATSLSDVPDWFPIVIVITFMVVLILLTVMIVRAVRGSGLMGEEGA